MNPVTVYKLVGTAADSRLVITQEEYDDAVAEGFADSPEIASAVGQEDAPVKDEE